MKQTNPNTLRSITYQTLLSRVKTMAASDNRFLPEDDIAHELGISRATVREAMQRLSREGYMTSRKGKGNFGHPSIFSLKQRIDLTSDFMKLLDNGTDPVVCQCTGFEEGEPSAQMQERCKSITGNVFRQYWVYSIKGAPHIYCRLETPLALLVKAAQPPQTRFHFLRWLEEYCLLDVAYSSAHFNCCQNEYANRALLLPTGSYTLRWQEMVYDINDREVSCADICFHPQVDISMIMHF